MNDFVVFEGKPFEEGRRVGQQEGEWECVDEATYRVCHQRGRSRIGMAKWPWVCDDLLSGLHKFGLHSDEVVSRIDQGSL